ncbi:hypothetical protein QBC44DRAFT_302928 [Cladorrhinum sp. PSN332]|nr:hypothetical protein QBC44DRAFT_302928 [Cladorrhinum sp. PSN332]
MDTWFNESKRLPDELKPKVLGQYARLDLERGDESTPRRPVRPYTNFLALVRYDRESRWHCLEPGRDFLKSTIKKMENSSPAHPLTVMPDGPSFHRSAARDLASTMAYHLEFNSGNRGAGPALTSYSLDDPPLLQSTQRFASVFAGFPLTAREQLGVSTTIPPLRLLEEIRALHGPGITRLYFSVVPSPRERRAVAHENLCQISLLEGSYNKYAVIDPHVALHLVGHYLKKAVESNTATLADPGSLLAQVTAERSSNLRFVPDVDQLPEGQARSILSVSAPEHEYTEAWIELYRQGRDKTKNPKLLSLAMHLWEKVPCMGRCYERFNHLFDLSDNILPQLESISILGGVVGWDNDVQCSFPRSHEGWHQLINLEDQE